MSKIIFIIIVALVIGKLMEFLIFDDKIINDFFRITGFFVI